MKITHPISFRPARRGRGFTLVEVMISVALVLMVIYGVSRVFKMTADSIGATQSLGGMTRDNRSVNSVLVEDFHNCLPKSPIFIISSRLAVDDMTTSYIYEGETVQPGVIGGYLNPDERRNDPDGLPWTIDLNDTPVPVRPAALSDRLPRLDRVGFFVGGLHRRQTANDNASFSAVTANEAFVYYGHAKTFANVLPNNQFARDRVLSRMCVLLKDESTFQSGGSFPGEQRYAPANNASDPLSPLSYTTMANPWIGRYDVAGTTAAQWKQLADAAYASLGVNWYRPLENRGNEIFRPVVESRLAKPYNSRELSKSVPYLAGSCVQFTVEYAGDFMSQDNDPASGTFGKVTGVSDWVNNTGAVMPPMPTDGIVDYVVDPDGSRRVRWYGLPRDVTGPDNDGIVRINQRDVIPLRDVVFANAKDPAFAAQFGAAAWEMEFPLGNNVSSRGIKDGQVGGDYLQYGASNPLTAAKNFRYVCAWRNAAPTMIRVSFKVMDPAGRLQEGQWYEYVLNR